MTEARASAHIAGMDITQPGGDAASRLALARNPETESQTLWLLIEDPDEQVADAARERLNLIPKPRPNTVARPVHIPVIDPKTGLVVRP